MSKGVDSSEFFVKEYLKQEFKSDKTSWFKIDKIHKNTHVPLKESYEKQIIEKGKTSIKFSSNKNEEL